MPLSLFADLVGYVRLSQADEEGTRARFQTDLSEVFKPNIATHKGRLVKTMGDALLVEFHSVVDALRCATTAHGRRICSLNTMSHRNCPSPRSQTEERVTRAGVNRVKAATDGQRPYQ